MKDVLQRAAVQGAEFSQRIDLAAGFPSAGLDVLRCAALR
jgi:hypothetical protein